EQNRRFDPFPQSSPISAQRRQSRAGRLVPPQAAEVGDAPPPVARAQHACAPRLPLSAHEGGALFGRRTTPQAATLQKPPLAPPPLRTSTLAAAAQSISVVHRRELSVGSPTRLLMGPSVRAETALTRCPERCPARFQLHQKMQVSCHMGPSGIRS